MAFRKYIRERFFPHIWCPGCGHGIILNSILHAVDELGIENSDMSMVSGIGCSARISGYCDFHTMHTMHGRALACATGLKLAKPSLNVIVPMGDGDATAIGGNHFIHACRRNIDLTIIVMNNRIYGMTGGQYSPLSGEGILATTAPYRSIDAAFDTVQLALGAGATFVARTTSFHAKECISLIKKGMEHKGVSVIEIMSQCPTYFGRKNKIGGAVELMESYRDGTAPLGSKKLEENPNLISRGIFRDEVRPEYCEEYAKLIKKVQG